MIAVLKKELKTYLTSLTTYLYYAIFFLALGIYFSVYCLSNYNTQFGYYVLAKAFYICILVIPFFTMRMFAQEKRRKTDQLLYTSPISATGILFGKYIATLITVFLPIVLSVIYPLVISNYGDMSVRFIVCTYIGVCLLLFAGISVGVFFSTITSNIFLAALFTYAVYIVFVLLRVVENIIGNSSLYHFIRNISPYNIYNDMISGVVKSGDIIYLILITLLFLVLAWININSRYLNAIKRSIGISMSVLVFLIFAAISFTTTKVYDFTPEGILTLSEETKNVISGISKKTDIYYMGRISSANATYTEFLKLYQNANNNINIHYKEIDNDINFQVQYMKDVSMINEASMLVICGDSYIYLDSNDYISTVQLSEYSYKSILEIEGQLTSAIYHVNQDDNSKIYCAEGHGESTISGKSKNYISLNGYDLKTLNFDEKIASPDATIPDDCDIILINSPETDYDDAVIDALKNYINDGGSIIFFLDPLNEDIDNLFNYFKECDMEIASGVVIEKDPTRYAYDTVYSLAPKLKEHDITNSLIEHGYYVYSMTSKGILMNGESGKRTDLLVSSAKSFSKVSDYDNISAKNDGDIGGPFSIASLYEDNSGKIFLMTSNLLMDDDADKDTLGGNHRFLISVLDYLSGREESIQIQGKDVSFNTAHYYNTKIRTIQILIIFVIPCVIILLGVIVILLRTKNILVDHIYKKRKDVTDDSDEK